MDGCLSNKVSKVYVSTGNPCTEAYNGEGISSYALKHHSKPKKELIQRANSCT